MTTLKFLVSISVEGTPPTKNDIRIIGANVDMALEIAEANGWILPEDTELEFSGYQVEIV